MRRIFSVFFVLFIPLTLCAEDEEWIDPNDPTHRYRKEEPSAKWIDPSDPSPGFSGGSTCPQQAGEMRECHDRSVRLLLRHLLHRLSVDPSQGTGFSRKARLSLSAANVEIVNDFLESERSDWDAHEKLHSALNNLVESLIEDDPPQPILEDLLATVSPFLTILNVVILIPAIVLLLSYVVRTRSLVFVTVASVFFISMYTTYDRMYKERVAARIAASHQDACRPPTFLEGSLEVLGSFFFLRKKSQCLQFIESQTVSVFSEIQLSEVFSEVLFTSLFSWMSVMGKQTNKFFVNLYTDLPLPLAIVVSVFVLITGLLCFIFFFGYRIRFLFFALEPHDNRIPLIHSVSEAVRGPPAPSILSSDFSLLHRPNRRHLPSTPHRQLFDSLDSVDPLPLPIHSNSFPTTSSGGSPRSRKEPLNSFRESDSPTSSHHSRNSRKELSPSTFHNVTPRSPERTARMRSSSAPHNARRSEVF